MNPFKTNLLWPLMPKFLFSFDKSKATLRDLKSGREVSVEPVCIVGKSIKLSAVGKDAINAYISKNPGKHEVINPFDHPRTFLNDFDAAVAVLMYLHKAIYKAQGKRAIVNPVIIVRPLMSLAEGLSQIELRALHDLAHAGYAQKAFIYTGPDMSDKELLDYIQKVNYEK